MARPTQTKITATLPFRGEPMGGQAPAASEGAHASTPNHKKYDQTTRDSQASGDHWTLRLRRSKKNKRPEEAEVTLGAEENLKGIQICVSRRYLRGYPMHQAKNPNNHSLRLPEKGKRN